VGSEMCIRDSLCAEGRSVYPLLTRPRFTQRSGVGLFQAAAIRDGLYAWRAAALLVELFHLVGFYAQ
jgi:hypothetical protein